MLFTLTRPVYSFGRGKLGRLGHGDEDDQTKPKLIETLRDKTVVAVSCGEQHSIAITDFGDIYTWGRGREGQLGHGSRNNELEPRRVDGLRTSRFHLLSDGKAASKFLPSQQDTNTLWWQPVRNHSLESSKCVDSGEVFAFGKLHRSDPNRRDNDLWNLPGLRM